MPRRERFYERPLRRPLDEETRDAIDALFRARSRELPLPLEMHWHPDRDRLVIRSALLSFFVLFADEQMIVDAELSLAARLMGTAENRRKAVAFIESVAADLDL